MKILFALVAALVITLGTAAAQGTPSSANAPARPSASPSSKPAAQPKVIVRSGGQGHNSGPDPKGKILVAPTTTSKGKSARN